MMIVAYAGLVFAAMAAIYRLVTGPTMADRIIALDLLLVSLMTAIVVDAVHTGDAVLFNVLAVIAIIGFTATVAVARFMERSR